jgi:HEAT repeat protein
LELFLIVGVAGVAVSSLLAALTWWGRPRQGLRLDDPMMRSWEYVAARVDDAQITTATPATLTGWIDRTCFTLRHVDVGRRAFRLTVVCPRDLVVWLRSRVGSDDRRSHEVATGDGGFDRDVCVQGDEAAALGLLGAEARSAVRALVVENDLRATGGWVTCDLGQETSGPELEAAIERVTRLVKGLCQTDEILTPLASNVAADPCLAVRARSLELLIERWPQAAQTRAACERALGDADDGVRVLAAATLGERGDPVLLELIGKMEARDEHLERAIESVGPRMSVEVGLTAVERALDARRRRVARAALLALGPHLPVDRAMAVIRRALGLAHEDVAETAITVLGRVRGREAVAALTSLVRGQHFGASIYAVRALGVLGAPGAEPVLLERLSSGSNDMVRAVVDALATCGTAAAVEPLRGVIEGHQNALEGPVRNAAERAIELIQARLTNALPGQLSLADASPGELSVVADAAGELSVADPVGPPTRE